MNQTAESLWFVFYKDELLLEKEGNGTFAIPCGEIPPILIQRQDYSTQYHHTGRKNCKPIPYPNLLKRQNNINDRASRFLRIPSAGTLSGSRQSP